jgi:hypothetical protein
MVSIPIRYLECDMCGHKGDVLCICQICSEDMTKSFLRSAAWLILYHEADEELKKKMEDLLGGTSDGN